LEHSEDKITPKLIDEIRMFEELIPKAAKLHTYTWCVKKQATVLTILLDAEECVRCSEFVLRGGICAPL